MVIIQGANELLGRHLTTRSSLGGGVTPTHLHVFLETCTRRGADLEVSRLPFPGRNSSHVSGTCRHSQTHARRHTGKDHPNQGETAPGAGAGQG